MTWRRRATPRTWTKWLNESCAGGDTCDSVARSCVSLSDGACVLDSQCAFGSICDGARCERGCRSQGDCVPGDGCVAGFCAASCADDNACAFGEVCDLATGVCALDTRGPYCLECTGGVSTVDCGDLGNYCLTSAAGSSFCGVDCGAGESCPAGYECQRVVIVPPEAPSCALPDASAPAGNCPELVGRSGRCELFPNDACAADGDCAKGPCILVECRGAPGDGSGACSCTRDDDCPTDSCVGEDLSDPNAPVRGHCAVSGRDCFEDFECDVITCVDGGCLIGSNCAPSNDVACP